MVDGFALFGVCYQPGNASTCKLGVPTHLTAVTGVKVSGEGHSQMGLEGGSNQGTIHTRKFPVNQ